MRGWLSSSQLAHALSHWSMGALLRRCGSSHAPPALYTHLASPSLPFALSATLSRCPPVRPLSNGRASTFARAAAGHVALEFCI
jgi:hypothetical protein